MLGIYNWTKTFLGKAVAILGVAVILMTFIDYLFKWQIYSYLLNIIFRLIELFYQFAFESFIIFWLLVLSFFFWKLQKRVVDLKSATLEKQITETKTAFEAQVKKISASTASQIKSIEDKFDRHIFDIRYAIVNFEIDRHRNRNQVGAVSKMIEKLGMDLKRGLGYEDTLLEIRGYIKKDGMPNYFLDDLHKTFERLPNSMKGLGDEIFKLAQEMIYDPSD